MNPIREDIASEARELLAELDKQIAKRREPNEVLLSLRELAREMLDMYSDAKWAARVENERRH